MVPLRTLAMGALMVLLPSIMAFCPHAVLPASSVGRAGKGVIHSFNQQRRMPRRVLKMGIMDDDEQEYQARLKARQEQEKLEELEENGPSPAYQIQPQYLMSEDLWPVFVNIFKSVTTLDAPGTRRRAAQQTILSVAAFALGSTFLFLALVPLGFVHRADPSTVSQQQMMVVNKKTFVDPDKILQEDFIRGGGEYFDDFPSTFSRTGNQVVEDDDYDIDI